MLSCKDTTRLASDAMDRELPFWQRTQLRLHLMMCKHCARYVDQLQKLRVFAGDYDASVGDEEPQGGLDEEAKGRLERALKAKLESPPGNQEDPA
ncbi:MAG: zf-HC2 domain-containing protein [Deltaproteobacteria bacterium]|nr:zf-HC2 domain-containing protein [Deltaproteobacteria bacterium]